MRLDFLVAEKLNISRTKAQNLIKEGKVQVACGIVDKPSYDVDSDKNITILQTENYVSRGAYKLVGAIEKFGLNFQNKIVLDMGASTGGFTQVCLINGASKVYSVDVGKGELDKSLVQDKRVVNMEGQDIRTLTNEMVKGVNIIVGDLSFISLKHILPKVFSLFGEIECALLFKPQFECGKEVAKKYRGVIKDKVVHKKLLIDFVEELKLYNFTLSNITYSSIKGKEGNIEYLLHLNGKETKVFDISQIVDTAFKELK
ncbi:MAG: TlyA family RNA methyltransferase [Clostridiales bacterium]|nr:TlyA family RNA methyltransferase [Clostridiales bacterium]